MQQKGVAIRKRTQIALANRTMFLWVAGVSVLFGISLVLAIFLTQMLFFNEKVLSEKNRTISTLDKNNSNVEELQRQVNILNTNKALIESKSKSDDQAIQVILDALPSDPNSLALGASLQNKLISGLKGLNLDSLQVDPVVGIESLDTSGTVIDASADGGESQNEITFKFSVSGNETALKGVLSNLERSIRTIDVTYLKIENQGETRMMTVKGRAFFEPAVEVKLKDKVIKQ
jgi:hypothetical protein